METWLHLFWTKLTSTVVKEVFTVFLVSMVVLIIFMYFTIFNGDE